MVFEEFRTAAELRENYKRVFKRRPPYAVAAPLPAPEPEPQPPPPPPPIEVAPPEPPPISRPPPGPGLHRDAIFLVVERVTGLSRQSCSSRCRTTPYVEARRMVCWLARKLIEAKVMVASTPQIGRWLGGLDHTSVLNATSRAQMMHYNDPLYASMLDEMLRQVRELTSDGEGNAWPQNLKSSNDTGEQT
jgi:Bacterial dnaA protein helix-turn-helix